MTHKQNIGIIAGDESWITGDRLLGEGFRVKGLGV